jgi:hypothetical protein
VETFEEFFKRKTILGSVTPKDSTIEDLYYKLVNLQNLCNPRPSLQPQKMTHLPTTVVTPELLAFFQKESPL